MPTFTTMEARQQVVAFAGAMERKLRQNDHKGGWLGMNNGSIMARIQQELTELTEALASKDRTRIRDEAADVANFLMMLCQNNKALDGTANEAPCKPSTNGAGVERDGL